MNYPIRAGLGAGGWGDGPQPARTSCCSGHPRGLSTLKGPRLVCRRIRRILTCTVTGNRREDAGGPRKPRNGEYAGSGFGGWDEGMVGTGCSRTRPPQGQVRSPGSCFSDLSPLRHAAWRLGWLPGRLAFSLVTARGRFRPRSLSGQLCALSLASPQMVR